MQREAEHRQQVHAEEHIKSVGLVGQSHDGQGLADDMELSAEVKLVFFLSEFGFSGDGDTDIHQVDRNLVYVPVRDLHQPDINLHRAVLCY